MLKIKYILPVFAMVLVLGLSNAAFAQLSCNVASTPVSRATDTGLTEPAGDLIFNCTQNTIGTTAATMTIDYGVPITSISGVPGWPVSTAANNGPIRIQNGSGTLTGGQAVTISSVNNLVGTVILSIPIQAGVAAPGGPGSFTLSGVLVALSAGRTAGVTANVSVSPGNNVLVTAGQNVATVITQVLPGLKAPALGTNLGPGGGKVAGTILASNVPVLAGGSFTIDVTENYIDALRSGGAGFLQFNSGANTNPVQLLYTFTGIPTGVTIGGCAVAVTQPAGSVGVVGTASIPAGSTLTAAAPTITVSMLTDMNLQAAETVSLSCTTFVAGTTAVIPFTPGVISATVTLAPTGTAFSSTSTPLITTATGGNVPRYTATQLGPVNVINIISATTHMLVPFVSVGAGYDTGFVVSNTTADPYGPTTAAGGARPQAGTVTIYFYPNAGTPTTTGPAGVSPFCVTTGGTATNPVAGGTGALTCTALSTLLGSGLTTGGTVAPGASWVVLGSQIFKAITGAPTVFNGYAFVVANFTNGHSSAFVADAAFAGNFAAGGPALVLTNPQIGARLGGAAVESLSH